MAKDLRTPLQKVTEEMTQLIDTVYEYSVKPNRALTELVNMGHFNWGMLYQGIPAKYRYLQGQREIGTVDFKKKLIERVEIMPCLFHAYIYRKFHDSGVKGQVYKFIFENASRISDCRERYLWWKMNGRVDYEIVRELYKRKIIGDGTLNDIWNTIKYDGCTITEDQIKEITREELLSIAQTKRKKALEMSEFINEVSLKLIKFPLVMTWDEMYEYYLRNTNNSQTDLDDARYYLDNGRDDKYAFDLDTMRSDYAAKTPWKSITKIKPKDGTKRLTIEERQAFIAKKRPETDSFNMKEQRRLMKHYVAPRFTFVIDYFFAGKYRYLLAINVNTRKAFFAIPDEIRKLGHNWNIIGKKGEWNVSSRSAIHSLNHIMEETEIRALIMDNESAFNSDAFRQFLERNDIKYSYVVKYNVGKVIETQNASRSTHTTSIIDRLCRTLRQMNNNLGNPNEINPPMMNYLIDEYNNAVHTTLSQVLKRKVTPNDVDEDINLENELVKRIRIKNFFVEESDAYQLKEGSKVRVYNDANFMDKVKPKLLPGTWEFVARNDGLYTVKNGKNIIKVPRWFIKDA